MRRSVHVLVWLALAPVPLALGCRGEEPAVDVAADSVPWMADTQIVRDSLGQELEIVIGRPARRVAEVEARAGSGDPDAPGVVRGLAPKQALDLMRVATPPWFVIDIRTSEPYAREGWIPGALLIELSILEQNIGDMHIRTDQTILVYDENGSRAPVAARLLASHGFPTVRWIEGGLAAWKEAGLPVEEYP
jgi:rhodanese-related sulfurtransferase